MTLFHRVLTGIGGTICFFWIVVSILAPVIAPFPALRVSRQPLATPGTIGPDGAVFWLGTDHIGRDILSRIIWSLQTDLYLIGGTVLLVGLIGLPIASLVIARNLVVAACASGIVAVARATPVMASYLVLGFATGNYLLAFVASFVFGSLPSLVEGCRALRRYQGEVDGASPPRSRILAWLGGRMLMYGALFLAVFEGLNFAHVGPFPPRYTTLGGMVGDVANWVLTFPHMVVPPLVALVLVLLGLNLLAKGLDGTAPGLPDLVDPASPSFRPGSAPND